MKFRVIYTFDFENDTPPPEKQRRRWKQTEREGTQRKRVALLPRKQFDEFVEHCGLRASETETMGAIGPWGWEPAISFDGDTGANAYVTPIPDVPVRNDELLDAERLILTGAEYMEHCWNRIRKAVLSVYG